MVRQIYLYFNSFSLYVYALPEVQYILINSYIPDEQNKKY